MQWLAFTTFLFAQWYRYRSIFCVGNYWNFKHFLVRNHPSTLLCYITLFCNKNLFFPAQFTSSQRNAFFAPIQLMFLFRKVAAWLSTSYPSSAPTGGQLSDWWHLCTEWSTVGVSEQPHPHVQGSTGEATRNEEFKTYIIGVVVGIFSSELCWFFFCWHMPQLCFTIVLLHIEFSVNSSLTSFLTMCF